MLADFADSNMKERIETIIKEALRSLEVEVSNVVVERPADITHGDYSTNVALVYCKSAGISPRELAEKLVAKIQEANVSEIKSVEIAGPGFINFKLSDEYFSGALSDAIEQGKEWGNNKTLDGKKFIIEYTDPNPFKEFHIGHLMSNTIGESISRIIEASGAETKRACYQGDVGLHVAKTVWRMLQIEKEEQSKGTQGDPFEFFDDVVILGKAYAAGAHAYENDLVAKQEIIEINKKIYLHEDQYIDKFYVWGRKMSLEYFEQIYKALGTKFDYYFFESKTGEFGKKVALENPEIFEKSDGALVYKGDESRGLHTRVFVSSEGLPTYEAKELGLAKIKYDTYPYDVSIVITGNEVNAYFKVILDAMSKVFPGLAQKTVHVSHGMLRLPTGKMSSRTGDVITAESLIADTKEKAIVKISEESFSSAEKSELAEKVAIGAIKYSILRQASGKDIIFDFEQSLSFEGDSGPYLQYTCARTHSLLNKAEGKKIDALCAHYETNTLHKKLLRFPEVVMRANEEREPHRIATYLIEVAREFNAFYAHTVVLDGAPDEAYKLSLVKAVSQTLKSGLYLLGISAPDKM